MNQIFEWLAEVKEYPEPGAPGVSIEISTQTLLQALEEEKKKSQKALQGWQESLEREQKLLNLCKELLQELRCIDNQQISNNQ